MERIKKPVLYDYSYKEGRPCMLSRLKDAGQADVGGDAF
jgi:hypothetical protein